MMYCKKALILLIAMTIATVSFAKANDKPAAEFSPEEKLMDFYYKASLGGDEGWKLRKDKNGIKIYTRPTHVSPVNAFKGVMEIKADISAMTAFLMDIDNYPVWVEMCADSKVIKQFSVTERYMYNTSHFPWPVKDRDVVTYRKWFQDPETLSVQVDFVGSTDFIPPQEGMLRLPLLVGYYQLTQKENGNLEVIFESIAEAGGWIPSFVINWTIVGMPYRTFTKFQELAPFEKYVGQEFQFIKKPPGAK
jgi:hypothetical protein